ncbi:MAG TPA: TadE family protein [Candidatus Dormibacteraeota bacterium]|nr:TadE family protein [Candidatus Dormibacteraeota bacterium]
MGRISRRLGRLHGRRRGQALVEFAIVLPVLMVMLLMAIDFGRLFFGWVATQNMARIAANYAANDPAGPWGLGSTYQAQINHDAVSINCIPPASWPAPTFIDGGTNIGQRVQVNLSCGFRVLTPIISIVVGSTVTVGASAVFPVKAGIIGGVSVGTAVPSLAPTPTPSPSTSPSPTSTPGNCTVPAFIGMRVNQASTAWANAGFVPSNLTASLGNGNYSINTETPPSSDGHAEPCASFVITVGP